MIGQYVTVHGDVISHVNISHVMVEDGGEYSCVAENRAGKTAHSARLNIYGKARDAAVTTPGRSLTSLLHHSSSQVYLTLD